MNHDAQPYPLLLLAHLLRQDTTQGKKLSIIPMEKCRSAALGLLALLLCIVGCTAEVSTASGTGISHGNAPMKATEVSTESGSGISLGNATFGEDISGEMQTLSPQLRFLYEAAKLPTFQAGLYVQRYCLPVIVILGQIGNFLSLAVMLQAHNRKLSCCVYMAGLAAADMGSLFTVAGFWVVTDGYPTLWTSTSCVIWVYFVYLSQASSAFILVAVTADRCLAIRWPLKARVWCTSSRAKKTLLIIVSLVAMVYIPIAMMSDVTPGNICAAFAKQSTLSLVLSYINLVLIPIIPFTLILVMNVIIIREVRASGNIQTPKERIQEKEGGDSEMSSAKSDDTIYKDDSKMSARNRQLTVMLLTVSVAYIIIFLPISVRVLAYLFIDYTDTPAHYAMFALLYNVVNNLLFLNNAINFYLYFFTGAKFRADLAKMLFCRK